MINVQEVLQELPHFETFCSVEKLHELVASLRADPRFEVKVAGTSGNGVPIHHVRFGSGSVKALFVAFPHCMEPIGGLTVFGLMTLLNQGNQALVGADVEWHIVPCIDPDGALLNEGWSQKPFTLVNYLKNYYLQPPAEQVDVSFPVTHRKLVWNTPSREAKILQSLLDDIRPDFCFSLHNTIMGGAWYSLNRDIGYTSYQKIYDLLQRENFPIQKRPSWNAVCAQYAEGIEEIPTIKKIYDFMEQTTPSPEQLLKCGAGSWDYLTEIKPDALFFVAEIGYIRHPSDESNKETGQNLRRFKLRVEADSKFLASVLLEEWEKVKGDLDQANPLYAAVVGYALPTREKVTEGLWPLSRYSTRDTLFNPQYGRTMTEGELFNACMNDGGFRFVLTSYQFLRLLKESPQSHVVRRAIERLEQAFNEVLADIRRDVDFDSFKVINCDTLARVQIGSGLIALNSVIERTGN